MTNPELVRGRPRQRLRSSPIKDEPRVAAGFSLPRDAVDWLKATARARCMSASALLAAIAAQRDREDAEK